MLYLIISNIYQIRKKLFVFGWRNSILKYKNKIYFKYKNSSFYSVDLTSSNQLWPWFKFKFIIKTFTPYCYLRFQIFVLHFLDTISSEPLLPPRASPACNNPQHSDFTTSWWWKLGKDLLAVALKRLLLSKCNDYKAKKWLLKPKNFK